jgi:ferredoxin-NADP reductase
VTVSLPQDDRLRRRCYSISGTPDRYSLRISVRRVGTDGVSALLHDKVEIGDEVLLGAPAGQFVLDSAPLRPVVLISAGVGITPLLPMAGHLAPRG